MNEDNSNLFNTSIRSINHDDDDSNFLDTSGISSISNDNINVTIDIVDNSGAIVGHLSGSMHLSDLNISHPSLLNNTTLPDDSFTGSDNSFSFNSIFCYTFASFKNWFDFLCVPSYLILCYLIVLHFILYHNIPFIIFYCLLYLFLYFLLL